MTKRDYNFPILVVCLLNLALQIHNPFISNRFECESRVGTQVDTLAETALVTPQSPPAEKIPTRPASSSRNRGSSDSLLTELEGVQEKARLQHEKLAAVGKMPPESPILQELRESEVKKTAKSAAGSKRQKQAPATGMSPPVPRSGVSVSGSPLLRQKDFGRFLEIRQPRGLGVVLGVGRGNVAIQLLKDWTSTAGIYLIDPYIHIWRGYDDPANVDDRQQQVIFEDLRQRLVQFDGRYVLIRDFSHSFAEQYRDGGMPLVNFVYVDANHAALAVTRDLETWWPLVAQGGVLAGSTYAEDSGRHINVRSAVDRFAGQHGLEVFLTDADVPPSWMIFKN